jgi:hypothetical protein
MADEQMAQDLQDLGREFGCPSGMLRPKMLAGGMSTAACIPPATRWTRCVMHWGYEHDRPTDGPPDRR